MKVKIKLEKFGKHLVEFGKYIYKTFEYVADNDNCYCDWVLEHYSK